METVNYKKREFILLGHSFGAYLSCLFAIKYPQKIEKLILLSPVGVTSKPPDWNVETYIDEIDTSFRRFLVRKANKIWNNHGSFFSILRKLGYYGARKLIFEYVEDRFRNLKSKDEQAAYVEVLL